MSAEPVPSGPKGPPLVGHLFAFRRDPLAFLSRIARDYPGDVVRFRPGPRDVYLLKHPDLIKDVLVTHQHDFSKSRGLEWAKLFLGEGLLTSEGEFHTRQRRLSQPAFHRQRIGSYAAVMADYAARCGEGLREGALFDMHAEMMALTLAVAAKTMCDADVGSEATV